MEGKKGLSGKEKFAYGIGAVGKDMVYMLSASYVLYYFQDIMGVSAVAMGIILLIARVFDAFNDPLMGVLVAKTKTRWGKFRPWLFIGTLTNAILLFVMFSAPPALDGGGLIAYAAVTYILWGVTYTMMDIPYWSMVPAFTEGGKERENLSALARTCAGVGSAIITIVTVIAVSSIGTWLTANRTDTDVLRIDSENTNLMVYLIEEDESNVATGKVKQVQDVSAELEIYAESDFFSDAISMSEENSDYTLTINQKVFDSDNSRISFAMDQKDAEEAVLAIYVDEENYATLGEQTNMNIAAELTSTNEVERIGFKYFALLVAILFFVFIFITCAVIKEKSTVDVRTPSVGEMFRALLQNDQAMTMVATIVLVNTATYITSNLLIYFFKYDLAGSNWQANYTIFNTFGGAVQILSMMLLFPLLRKFFRTIQIFYICIFSAIGGYVILLGIALSKTSSVYPFLIPGFFIMAAVGMMNVLVTIFLANTVDYGELKNHRRDESVIFSMQTFVVKLASGISALVASLCLTIFHISSTEESEVVGSVSNALLEQIADIGQPVTDTLANSSVIGLRMTMTIVPILVLVVAVVIFRMKYILTDEKLDEITQKLHHTQGGNV